MNGNRYPDAISNDKFQYTMPTGGLGQGFSVHGFGKSESTGYSEGLSLGGDFLQASTGNTTQKQSGNASGDKLSNGNYGGGGEAPSGDHDEDKKKKQQKNGEKHNNTVKAKQTKQQQNAVKRTYRQQRNALQHNAMFFNHTTPVTRRTERR